MKFSEMAKLGSSLGVIEVANQSTAVSSLAVAQHLRLAGNFWPAVRTINQPWQGKDDLIKQTFFPTK